MRLACLSAEHFDMEVIMTKYRYITTVISIMAMLAVCLSACSAKTAGKDAQAQETQVSEEAQASEEEALATADAQAETTQEAADVQTVDETKKQPDAAQAQAGVRPYYTVERRTFLDEDEEETMVIASGSYETIRLTEEAAAAYPALNDTLAALSAAKAEEAGKWYGEIKEAAVSYLAEYQEDPADFPAGEMTIGLEPVRCDSEVLSFFEKSTGYYPGAAHGIVGISGCSFDTAAGTAIDLTDVVTDPSALVPAVAENLMSIGDGMPVTDVENELREYWDENSGNLAWVIDRDALVVRFAPYDLASYARGMLEARIPYEKYPDLFTGKYGRYEGPFARQLNPDMPTALDLDGDGQTEAVFVTGTYGPDGEVSLSYSELEVTVGSMGCAEQADFNSWASVLVHTADGRNILLVDTRADSDYPVLFVFEAGSSGPVLKGKMEGMCFAAANRPGSGEDDGYLEEYPVLDPSSFALKEWSESGNSDVVFYEIGEDGMPAQL